MVEIGNYFASTIVQHFPKYETVYAHDPEGCYKPGDVVLAQKLPSRMTKHITHEVQEVVFKFGDVTDPVTGKKVVVGKYRYVTCSHLKNKSVHSIIIKFITLEMRWQKRISYMGRILMHLIILKPLNEVGRRIKETSLTEKLTESITCLRMKIHMLCKHTQL